MNFLRKVLNWLSSLKTAISLLIIIALTSGLGTIIPQNNTKAEYINTFNENPLMGLINGDIIIILQLDHIYSSIWFLGLLLWLSLALMICSFRRQLPILKSAIKWIDYQHENQIKKLSISEKITTSQPDIKLEKLGNYLQSNGWKIKTNSRRLAARKWVIGRVGPPLIHIGLVLLMIGSAWGAIGGQHIERFLAPGRSFELFNLQGLKQLTLKLDSFQIQRDPAGRAEQFTSDIKLIEESNNQSYKFKTSVNHPLRFKGLTIYQADWSLAAITVQIRDSPKLQFPLSNFPELGEQVWGVVIPTKKEGNAPILLTLSNENGPIKVYESDGSELANILPGGESVDIKGVPLKVIDIVPASGLILKRDPGIPFVYSSFAIILIGGGLSILSTKQIWAVIDETDSCIYIGGLSNRNLSGFYRELPIIISSI